MPPRSEAVLLLTHFLDEHIVSLYRRLAAEAGARDVRILFNATDDGNPGYRAPGDAAVWPFGEADLRSLGYPRKGRHISDLDIELFSFPFQRAHPEYEHVWIVEYDVDFTGSWSEVFDAFSSNDADLLATNIHRFADNPGWWNWRGSAVPGAEWPRRRWFACSCRSRGCRGEPMRRSTRPIARGGGAITNAPCRRSSPRPRCASRTSAATGNSCDRPIGTDSTPAPPQSTICRPERSSSGP